jgi:hypothetical protein
VHENIKKFIDGFHHDAHPMGILVSTLGALSTSYLRREGDLRRGPARVGLGPSPLVDVPAAGSAGNRPWSPLWCRKFINDDLVGKRRFALSMGASCRGGNVSRRTWI